MDEQLPKLPAELHSALLGAKHDQAESSIATFARLVGACYHAFRNQNLPEKLTDKIVENYAEMLLSLAYDAQTSGNSLDGE